jgi:hypothetical protein
MNTFTHTIQHLQLENYSLSLHELCDCEDAWVGQTISYESNNRYDTDDLAGLVEDAINADRSAGSYVKVAYATFPLTKTSALQLAF